MSQPNGMLLDARYDLSRVTELEQRYHNWHERNHAVRVYILRRCVYTTSAEGILF